MTAIAIKLKERVGMRSTTANSGFSVRQSEEAIKNLRKENFNLKLKLFMLENKRGAWAVAPECEDICNKEFFELFRENEEMKQELFEKHDLLEASLLAIQKLEDQNIKIEKKFDDLLLEQQIEAIKPKPKTLRRKKSQPKFSPVCSQKLEIEVQELQAENLKLTEKVQSLEMEIEEKMNSVTILSTKKAELVKQMKISEANLSQCQVKIVNLYEQLEQKNSQADSSSENERLKERIVKLSRKCSKLERDGEDMERLLREQSGLMKALHRTIEAKNDEMDELRNRYAELQLSSSVSDIYIPNEIDLNFEALSNNSDTSNYPFHNPLFGLHYQDMYR